MARGLNRVQIIGNLGADPEMRFTPSGTAVTNFRVAVSRNRRGNDGNMVEETEWFRVVAWDSPNYKLAEICNEYLRKGRRVYVEGRLQSSKYVGKEDGIERTSWEIVATEMIMLDGREDGQGGGGQGFVREGGDDRGRGGYQESAPRQERAPAGGNRGGGRPSRQNDFDDSDLDDVPF